MADVLVLGKRFNGPPASGNGGYSCGAIAGFLDGPAEVTLRAPPPLDRPLSVLRTSDGVEVHDADRLIGTARPATVDLPIPEPVSFAAAEAASEAFPWRTSHPLPGCFVCGSARAPGDGLRLFPGAVPGRSLAAVPWQPDATIASPDGLVTPECVWASLDCPSYFGIYARDGSTPNALLGRLAARIERRPRVGERCVILGWCTASDGRKHEVGSALFSADQGLCAAAKGTWVTLRS